jgi:hypothetical protein
VGQAILPAAAFQAALRRLKSRRQPEFRLLKNGLGMLTNALSLRRMQEWVGGEKAF